jgi:D-ribose pyranose/furanose isomerase RbsD
MSCFYNNDISKAITLLGLFIDVVGVVLLFFLSPKEYKEINRGNLPNFQNRIKLLSTVFEENTIDENNKKIDESINSLSKEINNSIERVNLVNEKLKRQSTYVVLLIGIGFFLQFLGAYLS